MKLIKAVTEKDIALDGVSITLQQIDGKIEAVIITDASGKYIRILKDGTYSDALKILIEEPKEYSTVYDLKIKKSDGGVVSYTFTDKRDLDDKIRYETEGEYQVTERLVEVVKDLNGKGLGIDLPPIPF